MNNTKLPIRSKTKPLFHDEKIIDLSKMISTDKVEHSVYTINKKLIKFKNVNDFNIETSFNDDSYQLSFLNAFQNTNYNEAIAFGENLLKIPDSYARNWWYGNLTHTTNIVLGKIYLAQGNIKKAEMYLLASVQEKYILNSTNKHLSPQLSTFGPDTSLAYDLFLIKRYDVIIDYFKRTKSFWVSGVEDGSIDEAIYNVQQVKNGEEIGPNDIESDFPFKRREVLD
ncbi:MAG: hypothetical protein Q7U04_02085 [Bacteriovorax sp.]|nr:hypothetical protein [Bacteriovorax sp.]